MPSKMKLNKQFVKNFEREQKQCGTEVALYNVFWLIAAEIFRMAGIGNIKTRIKNLKA